MQRFGDACSVVVEFHGSVLLSCSWAVIGDVDKTIESIVLCLQLSAPIFTSHHPGTKGTRQCRPTVIPLLF